MFVVYNGGKEHKEFKTLERALRECVNLRKQWNGIKIATEISFGGMIFKSCLDQPSIEVAVEMFGDKDFAYHLPEKDIKAIILQFFAGARLIRREMDTKEP